MKVKANNLSDNKVQQKSTSTPKVKGQAQKASLLNNQVVTERVAGDAVVSKNRGIRSSQRPEKIKDFKNARELAKRIAGDMSDSTEATESHDLSIDSVRVLLFD